MIHPSNFKASNFKRLLWLFKKFYTVLLTIKMFLLIWRKNYHDFVTDWSKINFITLFMLSSVVNPHQTWPLNLLSLFKSDVECWKCFFALLWFIENAFYLISNTWQGRIFTILLVKTLWQITFNIFNFSFILRYFLICFQKYSRNVQIAILE